MTDIRKSIHETPAVRVIELETADAGGGLHAFRSVSTLHDVGEDGERIVAATTTRQGFVDEENLDLLVSNRPFTPYQPYDVPKEVGRLHPMLATPEACEIARREGHVYSSEINRRLVAEGLLFTSDKSSLVEAVAGGVGFEGILFFASYDYALVDVRGRPLPIAMRFDYMEGGFDNENFDLEKVAEALSSNGEIEFTPDRWGRRNSPISEIPYYNAHDDRDQQVQFIWRPSEESWGLMLDKLGFDPVDPKHLRIKPETVSRDLDLFGIEQFRLDARDELDGSAREMK